MNTETTLSQDRLAAEAAAIKNPLLRSIIERGLQGENPEIDEVMEASAQCTTEELSAAADLLRRRWSGDRVDTCSIVNARSGRCGEDCKWCAQSAHHSTGVTEYEYIPYAEALRHAIHNSDRGVHRFSLVTSGRRVSAANLQRFCSIYRDIAAKTPIHLCASMGLLSADELRELRSAGVERYHCNLETAASFFPTLCTTHTHADKLRTIAAAREAGMEVCSGGIIGMGETMRQRLELAAEARDAGSVSMPVNFLNPIPGTPLEDTPLLEEEELIRSVAMMRIVAPKVSIRFAGGRARVSEEGTRRLLKGGVSGSLVGDMLTTVGNKIEDDYDLFKSMNRTY